MKRISPRNQKNSGELAGSSTLSCKITCLPPDHCCTILESIGEAIVTIDLNRTITYVNPAAETLTGYTAREAVGRQCFDVFRTNLCEKKCPLDEALASGDPQRTLRTSMINRAGGGKTVSMSNYLPKSENGDIIGAVESFRDLSELEQLRRQLNRSFTHEDIIGKHSRMREIISSLPDIAESESPVLIEGPTGSGKELIARAVHHLSPREGGPFIAVNCAALPDTLLESELFGYAKGAFTGAVRERAGRFLLANRGTLFLDEISNTSTAFQADLLRVLEDGEFIPLGGTRTVRADFRVIAASNMELKKLVQEENFREDLYYRLNVVRINLPRLRDRREDIPLLVDHFIRKFNLIKGKAIQGVAPEVLSFLLAYPFPGNIRELENIVEYAFVYCKSEIIGMKHLPEDLLEQIDDNRSLPPDYPLPLPYEEAQKIYAMLSQYKWNRQEVARALGISRSTLWRKMKNYGLMKRQNDK